MYKFVTAVPYLEGGKTQYTTEGFKYARCVSLRLWCFVKIWAIFWSYILSQNDHIFEKCRHNVSVLNRNEETPYKRYRKLKEISHL